MNDIIIAIDIMIIGCKARTRRWCASSEAKSCYRCCSCVGAKVWTCSCEYVLVDMHRYVYYIQHMFTHTYSYTYYVCA